MYRSRTGKVLISLAFGLALSGCGSSDSATTSGAAVSGSDSGADQGQEIHLLNGWNSPGDMETLQALLNVHKSRHPADSITIEPLPAAGAAPEQPGDVTMVTPLYAPDLSTLQPLRDFLASPSQADAVSNVYPELIAPTNDGSVHAVPIKLMRTGVLYYNKHLFRAQNLNPPTTLDELRTACKTFQAAGVGCISSRQPPFFIEAMLAASMGPEAYVGFRSGQHDEATVRKAVDIVADVVDNCLYTSWGTTSVLDDFVAGKLAMDIDASYLMAPFLQLGLTAGIDFGVATPPGNAGLFLFQFDRLAVLSDTPHLQGALNFLDSALSRDGVTAMCTYSKQIPVRKDVALPNPDSELQGLVQDMKDAKYRMVTAALGWYDGVNTYLKSRDKEVLVQAVLATP